VHQPVVDTTERDDELIAGLAPEDPRLGESQVVRIRGFAADQAGLLRHMPQVFFAAEPTGRRNRKRAVVDALRSGWFRGGDLPRFNSGGARNRVLFGARFNEPGPLKTHVSAWTTARNVVPLAGIR
jgi:hypothetical protein